MRKLGVYVATIFVAGAILATAIVIAVPALGNVVDAGDGEHGELDLDKIGEYAVRSEVFGADGTPLAVLHAEENREPVPLSEIPDNVKQAIIAVEDAQFYNHGGVNVRALGRALLENVQAGKVTQGGSTITQQLVKNVYLTTKQDFDRKTKEAVLALRLEQEMTKDEILEAYLNTVYFGAGAYGVEAAAETYWGMHVDQLGWGESAMLAAIISNPLAYDPTLHPEEAKVQRRLALDRMLELGIIDQAEHEGSDNWWLPTARCTGVAGPRPGTCGDVQQPTADSYVADAVVKELQDFAGHPEYDEVLGTTEAERYNAIFGGGLKINVTVDPVAQAAAEQAHDRTLTGAEASDAAAKGVTNAMVSVESATGAIRAFTGGRPWSQDSKYNVALQENGRQTGSTFKTFVLLTALEQGDIPDDVVGGAQCWKTPKGDKDPQYCPRGSGGTITSITRASSNAAFVRLGQTVGLNNVVDMAERLGITSAFNPQALSMPLGVFDVTPLEMASAYSAIPNGGIRQEPYLIESIEDRFGNVLWSHEQTPTRAFSSSTACYATEILQANVDGGTGTRARLAGYPAAGKTGTTDKNADVWFVGFTPQLTTAVWMGNPDNSETSMGSLGGTEQFGGKWPATIWRNFNQSYLDQVDAQLPGFASCPNPGRGGRPAAGAAEPFGTLNGGRAPTLAPPPRPEGEPAAEGDPAEQDPNATPAPDAPVTDGGAPPPGGGNGNPGNGGGGGN
ncbi:MAG TPA: transglycosylase domain-containing protein, partial [Acidimicrobiales bacterium]